MKKSILVMALFASMTSFAGDLYMNCGKGTVETMEEFTSSVLVSNQKAHGQFSDGLDQYTVVFDNGAYTVTKSNVNEGGFTKTTSTANNDLQESELFDGFSCYIND